MLGDFLLHPRVCRPPPPAPPPWQAPERGSRGAGPVARALVLSAPCFSAAAVGWPSPSRSSPQLSLTGEPLHGAWLQPALSRENISVASFMLVSGGLAPCRGLAVGSVEGVEILLLLGLSSALSRRPQRSTISAGALRLCGWRDLVDREILPCYRDSNSSG